ncbi:putative membrane protein [Wickerhamomyces ciferrii]|uniref:Membrane protein n=1 Tax=Wickerhamomyces ciferrii (strain ATCC 14091 / BCRC 22168 / CBS 111 / JCM 3599 / NBRC 0793 / NRRL Y-1031 F-60-10) TaxID=1206466 RepID=K0KCU0_WICCF|nr:uncharacterized protein BN7_2456 [Wickerhamomyces ciferrii]CCH42910.1 putative membrane protein [Wickerhamomyces ciferrii]
MSVSQSLPLRIIHSLIILILVPKTYMSGFLALSIIKPDISNISYNSKVMKMVWGGCILMKLNHVVKYSKILYKKWDYYNSREQTFNDSLGPLGYEFLGGLILIYLSYEYLKNRDIALQENDDEEKK